MSETTTEDVRAAWYAEWAHKVDPSDRVAAFDAWLSAERAKAWDEGFATAARWNAAPMCRNPYRHEGS